jgi:hypothetical protein
MGLLNRLKHGTNQKGQSGIACVNAVGGMPVGMEFTTGHE